MPRTPTTPRLPGLSRREIALVGALALAGIVGAWIALAQLAGMRAELDAVRRGAGTEIVRLRAAVAEMRQREKEQAEARVSAPPAPSAAVAAEASAVARADRMSALLAWARLNARNGGGAALRLQSLMAATRARAAARTRNPDIPIPPIPGYLLSPSYEVPPRFGELFDLREDQVAQFQQAVATANARVDALVVANTRVQDNGNGSYTLEVKAVPESEIAAERERMLASMRQVLGDDGYEAFALLNGDMGNALNTRASPRNFFNAFGTIGRVATISKNPQGVYRYEMTYGEGGRASGGGESVEALAPEIGAAVKLLPPGF